VTSALPTVSGAPAGVTAAAPALAADATGVSAADAAAWQRIAAVVVTHHSQAVIGACLHGLAPAGRIVLVDNASDDDTLAIAAAEAPDAVVVKNATGVGYGNGVNCALPHLDREFALLANPDSILRPGAVAALVAAADAWPEAALFGPTVIAPDGSVELSHDVPLFDRRAYGKRSAEAPPEGPCCTEFLSGAVTLVRTDALRALGGFDPALFLYYEDDDFCLRLAVPATSSCSCRPPRPSMSAAARFASARIITGKNGGIWPGRGSISRTSIAAPRHAARSRCARRCATPARRSATRQR